MSDSIETVDQLVKAFGGTGKFAGWLDVVPSTVSNWKELGKIPSGWHLRLYLECQHRGLPIMPGLFGVREHPSRRAKKWVDRRYIA